MCTRIHTPSGVLRSVADLQAYLGREPVLLSDGPLSEVAVAPLDATCLCAVDVDASLEGMEYSYDSRWDEYFVEETEGD